MSDTVRALKEVYKAVGDNYLAAKDSFYDCEKREFHLLVSAECLALAECKMIIAGQIIKELENK